MIDVVFDIDNTLVRSFRAPEQVPKKFIDVGVDTDGVDYLYRILDGTPEILQALSKNQKVRMSVFSLGSHARNVALLNQLKLPNGKRASDVIYRVLSGEDGTRLGKDEFKDLRKVNPDLSRVLVVEDTKDSTLPEQRGHVLWIGNKPEIFPSDLKDPLEIVGGLEPKDPIARFVQYRNRLAYALGSILKVEDEANRANFSIEQTLDHLQWATDANGNRVFKEAIEPDLQIQRRGVREFHAVNPSYHYTSALPDITPIQCIADALKKII